MSALARTAPRTRRGVYLHPGQVFASAEPCVVTTILGTCVALCLWDPAEMFWTPEISIAATIIPWTSEWLLFFEYWQISGEFLGPGRHPPRRRNECPKPPETSDRATRARRERFRNDEFHRIGRKTGVFGSYLSMGAALRDCSLQLFSPSWNGDISAAGLSQNISIWSSEPQLVESSHLVSAPA